MDSKLKPELKHCDVDRLELGSEVSSNIYFKATNDSSPILVLKIGSLLETKVLEKIKQAPKKFFQDDLLRPQTQVEIKNILELFFAAVSIEQKKKLRCEFFSKLNSGEFRFIEISHAFKKLFSKLPKSFYQDFYDINETLYNHANQVAVTASLLALTQDFYDKKFVSDIYMLCWFLDVGLATKDSSYHLMKACEEERLASGAGLSYLENVHAKEIEKELFLKHPIKSYEKGLEYKEFFTHPHLLEMITLHHENSDGTGFPYKRRFEHISKIEQLIILTDRLASFEKIQYGNNSFVFKDFFRKIEKVYKESNKVIFMAEKIFRESA